MKTLAIRLEDEQHAQLAMIAQLEELTVSDAIRQALEAWIDARRSNPELQARAEAIIADIDREAATRRDAISALLQGETTSAPTTRQAASRRTGRSKGGDAASE